MARLAIVIPTYRDVSSTFFAHFLGLDRKGLKPSSIIVSRGVYVAAAMRGFATDLLKSDPHFERMLVLECDMIPPKDVLQKHSRYDSSTPIVGSAYFMHHYPYQPIFTAPDDVNGYHRTFSVKEVRHMMENPGLYECMNVGFGCTSISREVLENWPADEPIFANRQGVTADGKVVEMGHDVAFTLRARQLGYKSYVDTSVRCGHLTETSIGAEDNARAFTQVVQDIKDGRVRSTEWHEDHWEARLTDLAGTPGAIEDVEDYAELAHQHFSTRTV